ncbi:hypothetical protein A8C32_00320 [Flavivirga aquatica]|uniref:Uncharacterized protein n=1 Tax=Flavivirga aquatica TaxID=1849968 RepID=A0A1E5TBP8_9FLAO|nr:hypothetical protein [Flavivirga aquatica]OEK08757.1 hypothetical protein A8C32_00320 [Flavivirga aquatica]
MLSIILTSCKENNATDKTLKEQDSPSQIQTKKNTGKSKTTNNRSIVSKTNISKNQFESSILDFQSCKSISKNRLDCRNQISKFIGEVYHINDFKDKDNDYIIFDSIQPIIKRSKSWKNLGAVT